MQQLGYQLVNPIALGVAIAFVDVIVALVMMPMIREPSMQMSPVIIQLVALVGGFVIGFLVAWIYNAIVVRMSPLKSRAL